MNFIKIPNDFVQDNKYNNETIFIYALLQKNLTIRKQIIFSLNWLFETLNISKDNTTSRKRIKENLLQLHNKYINYNCDILKVNNNQLIFATLIEIENSFVKISDYEFDKIHKYNNKDVYNIFCLFASIKSRIGYIEYCYPSFDMLKNGTGINSDTSISLYLKILQNDLHLILYKNLGTGIIDNKTSQLNNVYVIDDEGAKDLLEEAIKNRKNELNKYYKKIEKAENANKKRSLKMKEHWKKIKGLERNN